MKTSLTFSVVFICVLVFSCVLYFSMFYTQLCFSVLYMFMYILGNEWDPWVPKKVVSPQLIVIKYKLFWGPISNFIKVTDAF